MELNGANGDSYRNQPITYIAKTDKLKSFPILDSTALEEIYFNIFSSQKKCDEGDESLETKYNIALMKGLELGHECRMQEEQINSLKNNITQISDIANQAILIEQRKNISLMDDYLKLSHENKSQKNKSNEKIANLLIVKDALEKENFDIKKENTEISLKLVGKENGNSLKRKYELIQPSQGSLNPPCKLQKSNLHPSVAAARKIFESETIDELNPLKKQFEKEKKALNVAHKLDIHDRDARLLAALKKINELTDLLNKKDEEILALKTKTNEIQKKEKDLQLAHKRDIEMCDAKLVAANTTINKLSKKLLVLDEVKIKLEKEKEALNLTHKLSIHELNSKLLEAHKKIKELNGHCDEKSTIAHNFKELTTSVTKKDEEIHGLKVKIKEMEIEQEVQRKKQENPGIVKEFFIVDKKEKEDLWLKHKQDILQRHAEMLAAERKLQELNMQIAQQEELIKTPNDQIAKAMQPHHNRKYVL